MIISAGDDGRILMFDIKMDKPLIEEPLTKTEEKSITLPPKPSESESKEETKE